MMFSELLQDVRFGARTLRKSPGFTTVALATLAVGIGANTAIFSFVHGVMLKPLPYADPERIVRVLEKPPGGERNGISTLNYLDWKNQNTVFEYMAAQTGGSVTLTGVDEPIQLRGLRVSADYFSIFGVSAALGRTFAAGEDQPGQDRVVVLSHAFWQAQFGGDQTLLGRTITLDGQSHTVIGILPESSAFDRGWPQIWRPLAFAPENHTRNFHWFGSMAKLKPGVTLQQARANLDAIAARIAQDFPDSNKGWGVTIDPIVETYVGKDLRHSIYLLFSAVGAVLLIGCANLANLMLVRGLARDREVALRAALGAGRWRLVRQFLTESILLAGAGGALGLGVGFATMVALKQVLPKYTLPPEANVTFDGGVLAFAVGLALATGIICGLIPALQATRTDLTTGLKQAGGGASASRVRHRMRTVLVVSEVALAFVLLTSAGLFLRSFAKLHEVDLGFDSKNVLTAQLPIPANRFETGDALNTYLRQIHDAVAALPGVEEVSFTSALPMRGWGYGMPFQRADRPLVDRANRNACFFKMVSPSYFEALGLKLRQGRTLNERDRKGTPPVTVITETMRRRYFGKEDPIGKRILIQEIAFGRTSLGSEIPWEVVGVVADEKVGSLSDKEGSPGVYVTLEQSATAYLSLVIRCAGDPALLHRPIRQAVNKINPDQSLPEMKTLEQIKTESLGGSRLSTILIGVFAGVALLLASIGIYGVISYSVAQRTREIGIRTALGADSGSILWLVLRHAMETVLLGMLIGTAGVFAVAQLMTTLLFGVGERDPLTLLGVGVILGSVALVACFLPARRAARLDPIVALREE